MTLYEQTTEILKKSGLDVSLNEVEKSNPNHDSLGRFTFGKMLSPHTGSGSGGLSDDEQRCILANKTSPITGINPLNLSKANYFEEIHSEIKNIDRQLSIGNYKYDNKKITSVDEEHIFSHIVNNKIVSRDLSNLKSHAAYLPFVLPMLNSKCAHADSRNRVEPDGRKTYEFIQKATITENGKPKNIGIALILKENERGNELSVSIRTVFRLYDNKNLIKSWQAGEPNLLERQEALLHSTKTSSNQIKLVSFVNSSITPSTINTIPQKPLGVNKSIQFEFTNITPMNSRVKLEKAIRVLSKQLGVPVEVEKRHTEQTGEPFHFAAQEELTYAWYDYFSQSVKAVYDYVIDTFGLPESNVIQKAGELKHKGQILYSPETGEPIKKADWDKFVKALEKLLNQKFGGAGKKITLDSRTLGRLLDRMLKYNKLPEVKDISLSEIKYSGKSFEAITESAKTAEKVLGAEKTALIETLEQSAAERITGMTDRLKNEVKQTLIDGIKAHKGKQQISQDLFNRLTGTNRDFHKIADTEIQNNINNSFLAEETKDLEEGEKAYFQRMEMNDGNACPFCKKMNGIIAVWSKTPLSNDKVDNDPYATVAIWEGKDWNGQKNYVASGIWHPFCRGIWVRWNARINAYAAYLKKRSEQYNTAVDKAREEWKAKGIENPTDKTPGYIDRINELYNAVNSP